MKIYLRSTGHKNVLGITVMYIGFDQLEIDLGNVCTLTAVNCMFTHVEAYCLLKIFPLKDKYFIDISKVSGCCTIPIGYNHGQQQCQHEELGHYYFLLAPARLPLEIGAAG